MVQTRVDTGWKRGGGGGGCHDNRAEIETVVGVSDPNGERVTSPNYGTGP